MATFISMLDFGIIPTIYTLEVMKTPDKFLTFGSISLGSTLTCPLY